MTIQTHNIRSIGFLHSANGDIILTPVMNGEMHPKKVSVSKEAFDTVKGDKQAMTAMAASKISEAQACHVE